MKLRLATMLCTGILMAIFAAPAFAHDLSANEGCREGDTWTAVQFGYKTDRNQDLGVCSTPDGRYYDNHLHEAHGGGGGWAENGCRAGDTWTGVQPGHDADRNQDLAVCRTTDGRYYDNRLPKEGGGGSGGWADNGCREGDTWLGVQPGHEADRNQDLAVCSTGDGSYYDNRLN